MSQYPLTYSVKGVPFKIITETAGFGWESSVPEINLGPFKSLTQKHAIAQAELAIDKRMQKEVRSAHQIAVDKFMIMAGQHLPLAPIVPDENRRKLRARLILEEALETIIGLGCRVNADLEIVVDGTFNMIEAVDGCFDLRVVATGTLSHLGIPDVEGQWLVDENNLNKFGSGHSIREDGKLIKPPDHKPPAIAEWIEKLCKE